MYNNVSEEGKQLIQKVDGRIAVHPLKEVVEDLKEKIVVFKCKIISGKIENLLMGKVLPHFSPSKWRR